VCLGRSKSQSKGPVPGGRHRVGRPGGEEEEGERRAGRLLGTSSGGARLVLLLVSWLAGRSRVGRLGEATLKAPKEKTAATARLGGWEMQGRSDGEGSWARPVWRLHGLAA